MALAQQRYLPSAPISSYPGGGGGGGFENGGNVYGDYSNSNNIQSPSWDDHYSRRGRSRSRGNKGSRGGSTAASSTSRGGGSHHHRPRSADSRPEYHSSYRQRRSKYNNDDKGVATLRCFDRIFPQPDPVVPKYQSQHTSPSAQQMNHHHRSLSPDDIRRSRSEEHHHTGDMGTFHNKNGYGSSPNRHHIHQNTYNHHHHHQHTNPDRYNMKYPLHPYNQHQLPTSHDYIQTGEDEPIVYGELDSVTTGQSQQGLLQQQNSNNKRSRSKEKKIVNLPPSLFSTFKQQQQEQRQYQKNHQWSSPQRLSSLNDNTTHEQQQRQYDDARGGASLYRRDDFESLGSHDKNEEENPANDGGAETPGSNGQQQQQKGWRGLMVKRQSSTGSSKSRWRNIIPALSRSRSQSPGRNTHKKIIIERAGGPVDIDEVELVSTAGSTEESDPVMESQQQQDHRSPSLLPSTPPYNTQLSVKDLDLRETGDTVDFHSAMTKNHQQPQRPTVTPSPEKEQQPPHDPFPDVSRSLDSSGTSSSEGALNKPISYKQFTPKSRLAKYALSRSKQLQQDPDYSNADTYKEFDPFAEGDPVIATVPSPPRRDTSGAFPTLEASNTNNDNSHMVMHNVAAATPRTPVDQHVSTTPGSRTGIRWSDNLDQSPTPTRGSLSIERPKSILRCVGGNPPTRSDLGFAEYPSMEEDESIPSRPSTLNGGSLGFVDTNGRSVSPIFDEESSSPFDEPPSSTEVRERVVPKATAIATTNASRFEKSLPPQYQQANSSLKADDDSGIMSDAYIEFIESVASVVVQTAVRQFLARAKLRKLRQQREAERSQHKGHSAGNLEILIFELAAVRIQSAYRGWFARDCITVDNYCACIIQKNFRAYQCRNQYRLDLYRIVRLQALIRRRLALEDAATRLYCVIAIQAAFRGYKARKNKKQPMLQQYHHRQHHSRRLLENVAAIEIQKQWRSYYCEVEFLKTYVAILLIQSVYRGWRVRNRVQLTGQKARSNTSPAGGRPPKNSDDYKLPQSYYAHTAFMKRNLSVSRDSDDESSQPSLGMATRAARAEIEKRRREQEGKRKALEEEERQQEEKRILVAEAKGREERRRKFEEKAKNKAKQDISLKKETRNAHTIALPTPSAIEVIAGAEPVRSASVDEPCVASKQKSVLQENHANGIDYAPKWNSSSSNRPQLKYAQKYREKVDIANGFVIKKPLRDPASSFDNAERAKPIRNASVSVENGSVADVNPDAGIDDNGGRERAPLPPSANTPCNSAPSEEAINSSSPVKHGNKQTQSVKKECSGASKIHNVWRAREQNQKSGNHKFERPHTRSLGKLNVKTTGGQEKLHSTGVATASGPMTSEAPPEVQNASSPASKNTNVAVLVQKPPSVVAKSSPRPPFKGRGTKVNATATVFVRENVVVDKNVRSRSAQRRDRIMDSLGIGPSNDDVDSDSESLPSDEDESDVARSVKNQQSQSKTGTGSKAPKPSWVKPSVTVQNQKSFSKWRNGSKTPQSKSPRQVVAGIDVSPATTTAKNSSRWHTSMASPQMKSPRQVVVGVAVVPTPKKNEESPFKEYIDVTTPQPTSNEESPFKECIDVTTPQPTSNDESPFKEYIDVATPNKNQASPSKVKNGTTPPQLRSVRKAVAGIDRKPSEEKNTSPHAAYHILMESKRSPKEQERLDNIHAVFSRTGLMMSKEEIQTSSVEIKADVVKMNASPTKNGKRPPKKFNKWSTATAKKSDEEPADVKQQSSTKAVCTTSKQTTAKHDGIVSSPPPPIRPNPSVDVESSVVDVESSVVDVKHGDSAPSPRDIMNAWKARDTQSKMLGNASVVSQ